MIAFGSGDSSAPVPFWAAQMEFAKDMHIPLDRIDTSLYVWFKRWAVMRQCKDFANNDPDAGSSSD